MAVPVLWLDEVGSTNTEARRLQGEGETGPLWIAARRQTAGRGRRGRAWDSAPGNLAATLLLTPGKPPAEAAQLAFVAALAVADMASLYVDPAKVALKWPNDPLLSGAKLGGILIEAMGEAVAVGVGVNLTFAPEKTLYPAVALADHMQRPPPAPDEAMAALAAAFDKWLAVWRIQDFPPIAAAWKARAAGLGEACTVRLPDETLHGVALDLEPDGALRLALADGSVRKITAGDVFLGRA